MRDNEDLDWPRRHVRDKVTKMGSWLDVRVRSKDRDSSNFSSLFDCEKVPLEEMALRKKRKSSKYLGMPYILFGIV